ncbi:MAG: pilus assembly protein PilO [Desulfuromonas sp.]|nr:MAG: pilus assembly protein PilO [Desulfuromonas sp.]
MNPRIEKLFNLPLYQRLLILLVLVLLIAGGYVYMFFMPGMEEIQRLESQSHELDTKLQQDRRIANNLPKFKEEYLKMQEKLDEALTELPDKKEIPSLLTSIAAVAKESGLEIINFKPEPEQKKGFYAVVPVSLKMEGSYHEVAQFSYEIGNLSRIVNLGNLSLTAPKMRDDKMVLGVTCKATTFRFLDQK